MLVAIVMEERSQQSEARKIAGFLSDFDLPSELYIASAHKVPELVLSVVEDFNRRDEEMVYITLSSGTNALSSMVAANSVHPVIACPLFKDHADYLANIHSSLNSPPEAPSLVATDLKNAALAAARILGLKDRKLQKQIARQIKEMKEGF
jgi:5-(carboxyamino)imidazole ribonucleotide mutase